MFMEKTSPEQLRADCVNFMREDPSRTLEASFWGGEAGEDDDNKDKFLKERRKIFLKHLQKMQKITTMGTDVEIDALSRMSRIPILAIYSTEFGPYINQEQYDHIQWNTVYITNYNNHYTFLRYAEGGNVQQQVEAIRALCRDTERAEGLY
jgi:hypothetical protein